TMKVYDVLGKEVATLINEEKAVGRYSTTFDGSRLSSGTYIVRMNAGEFVKTMKVTLLK
ncbi:MAG: T9SS type A sorting domain-containing protein, partial [Bacteroidetes bacterium]|nr:T9SS type A sorting domain-containing protein [Bacteroidota bacterium]NUN70779.1 T9SS type A sorting domain-containing protein [Bacteroidota bacterium]